MFIILYGNTLFQLYCKGSDFSIGYYVPGKGYVVTNNYQHIIYTHNSIVSISGYLGVYKGYILCTDNNSSFTRVKNLLNKSKGDPHNVLGRVRDYGIGYMVLGNGLSNFIYYRGSGICSFVCRGSCLTKFVLNNIVVYVNLYKPYSVLEVLSTKELVFDSKCCSRRYCISVFKGVVNANGVYLLG